MRGKIWFLSLDCDRNGGKCKYIDGALYLAGAIYASNGGLWALVINVFRGRLG